MAHLFPLMPEHLRPALKRVVAAIPAPWLLAPITGEVFDPRKTCKKRLQAFVLTQGFTVVVGKSNKDRLIFYYVYHSVETRNIRGLKPRIERNAQGKIINYRQRDIYYKKKDYL
jgi:hypothetical protein